MSSLTLFLMVGSRLLEKSPARKTRRWRNAHFVHRRKDSQWHRLFLCDKTEFKLIREKAHKLQLDAVANGLLAGDG
jgi:hypothetical protein